MAENQKLESIDNGIGCLFWVLIVIAGVLFGISSTLERIAHQLSK